MTTVFFLLPHCDDEVFARTLIQEAQKKGHVPVCVFLTKGNITRNGRQVREEESSRYLVSLGIKTDQIHFSGTKMKVPAGKLTAHLDSLFQLITGKLAAPETIYCPAWEGGHQDHDAAYVLGAALAAHYRRLHQAFQYFTYNGHDTSGKFFKVFSPIKKTSGTRVRRIPIIQGLSAALSSLSFRSQWKTWVGLFPVILFHFLWKQTEITEPVSFRLLEDPPHPGTLLYERYGRMTFQEFKTETGDFLKNRILNSAPQ